LDEASLIRPSGAAPISSMDQFAYNNYNNYNAPPPDEGFNIREIWRKVRKRKWLVLSVAFIATTVVTVEAFRTKAIYTATAKIAVNNDNPAVLKLGDAIIGMNDSERIKTDLLLLRTYPLLGKVVLRLKLSEDPRFLESGERRTVTEAVRAILAKFSSKFANHSAAEDRSQLDPLPMFDGALSTQEIERLTPYIQTLDGSLFVAQIEETRAIQISFTHTDPALAASVANGVARVFVDESDANKIAKVDTSTSWLDKTTRQLKAKAEESEAALASYSSSKNIFSTDDKQNLVIGKLSDLYGKAMHAETETKLKGSLYEEVKQGRVAQLPEAFSDPGLKQSQTQLAALRVEYSKLTASFGPENPNVIRTQNQITELVRQINEATKNLEDRLKADYERAVREEKLIKESLEAAKTEAIQQNQASVQFNIYKQNAETSRSLYTDFLKQTSQAQIDRKQGGSDLRIIEPARTGTPTGPGRSRTIFIGLIMSLVGGVGLALLLEWLDNTVKSVEDVSRATQLPTLALIPSMDAEAVRTIGAKKNGQKIGPGAKKTLGLTGGKLANVAGLAPRGLQPPGEKLATLGSLSSVVESYRMLRTAVLLSTAGAPPKTILFTSSQPGEGKTTTAVNTAISLAQLGVSVLLIDADLRRPAVHKAFKIPQSRGISNYLSSHTPLENLIVKLPIPNLSVLPCGPIPPNPAELISSDRMKDLLRNLSQQFDHILIDSPPLISVTDPVILSTMVDGSILVVQSGKSTRELVRRARQELSGVGAKVFGVVLNNVNIKREGYNDYDYYRYASSYNDAYRRANAG